MERHIANVCQKAATDLHRFDFDVMQQAHGGHLQHLESISLSCLHWEHELTQSQLLVMQSAIIHLAITRTVCIICENCHMIILCWPCLHVYPMQPNPLKITGLSLNPGFYRILKKTSGSVPKPRVCFLEPVLNPYLTHTKPIFYPY